MIDFTIEYKFNIFRSYIRFPHAPKQHLTIKKSPTQRPLHCNVWEQNFGLELVYLIKFIFLFGMMGILTHPQAVNYYFIIMFKSFKSMKEFFIST